jgi:hypothetical protein
VWQPDIALIDLNLLGKAMNILSHPTGDGLFPVLVMTNSNEPALAER